MDFQIFFIYFNEYVSEDIKINNSNAIDRFPDLIAGTTTWM
jgi:hypothetical protein